MNFEKIGGRKFVLSVLSMLLGVGVVLAGKPLTFELTGLIVGILAAFTGGNVMVSKAAINSSGKVAENNEQKVEESTTVQNTTPLIDPEQLNRIEVTVNQIALSTANTNKLLVAAITNKPV